MDGFFPKDADFLCKGKSWARVWKKRRGLLKALKASESFAKRKAVNSGRRLAWLAASQWNSELFVQTGNPTKAVGPMQRPRLLLKSLMQRNLENQFEKEGGGGEGKRGSFLPSCFFSLFAIFLFDSKVVCWWLKMVCSLQICRWAKNSALECTEVGERSWKGDQESQVRNKKGAGTVQ